MTAEVEQEASKAPPTRQLHVSKLQSRTKERLFMTETKIVEMTILNKEPAFRAQAAGVGRKAGACA